MRQDLEEAKKKSEEDNDSKESIKEFEKVEKKILVWTLLSVFYQNSLLEHYYNIMNFLFCF